MVQIEHAGNAIEAEAIKVILVHPESEIAQQESHDLVMAVVEESAVPKIMVAFASTVKVLVVGSIEFIESIKYILRRMAMNHVQQHDNSHLMSSIHKPFQTFRSSIPAARSKEAVDLVSETSIVSMFHNSHQLDSIVAKVLDSGKQVVGELVVCSDTLLRRRNSDVGLIHSNALRLLWSWMLERIFRCGFRVPKSSIIDWRNRKILGDIFDPSWQAINSMSSIENEGDLIS